MQGNGVEVLRQVYLAKASVQLISKINQIKYFVIDLQGPNWT